MSNQVLTFNKPLNEITTQNFIKYQKAAVTENYKLIKKICKSAFGDVYKVYHNETRTFRCLKIYIKEKMEKTNQNQFEEEMEIIKALDHPNIFKIFEFYSDDDNFFLVTEYLDGGELFEFITNSKKLDE